MLHTLTDSPIVVDVGSFLAEFPSPLFSSSGFLILLFGESSEMMTDNRNETGV